MKEALDDSLWHVAMDDELRAFYLNKTWSLVPPPDNANVMT